MIKISLSLRMVQLVEHCPVHRKGCRFNIRSGQGTYLACGFNPWDYPDLPKCMQLTHKVHFKYNWRIRRGFENTALLALKRGPQDKDLAYQGAEKGKKINSLLDLAEGTQPCGHIFFFYLLIYFLVHWDSFQMSYLQNSKILNLCCWSH